MPNPFSNPDDDKLKMKLLEQLMGQMDERAVKPLLEKAKPPEEPEETKGPEPEAPAPEPAGDDLDQDTALEPELRDLIRAKRAENV